MFSMHSVLLRCMTDETTPEGGEDKTSLKLHLCNRSVYFAHFIPIQQRSGFKDGRSGAHFGQEASPGCGFRHQRQRQQVPEPGLRGAPERLPGAGEAFL